MKNNDIKKRNWLVAMLLLTAVCMTACGNPEQNPGNEATPGITAGETSPTGEQPEPTATPEPTEAAEEGIRIKEGSVSFHSEQSYVSFLKVKIALPEGNTPADITALRFRIENQNDTAMELRLYAGQSDVEKSSKAELTTEQAYYATNEASTGEAAVEGTTVPQESYTIDKQVVSSTRIKIEEKAGTVDFTVDEHAAAVLSGISGGEFVLGIYANEVAPSYRVSDLYVVIGNQEYKAVLDETTASSAIGGAVEFDW